MRRRVYYVKRYENIDNILEIIERWQEGRENPPAMIPSTLRNENYVVNETNEKHFGLQIICPNNPRTNTTVIK